jgi:hypothetical protein
LVDRFRPDKWFGPGIHAPVWRSMLTELPNFSESDAAFSMSYGFLRHYFIFQMPGFGWLYDLEGYAKRGVDFAVFWFRS